MRARDSIRRMSLHAAVAAALLIGVSGCEDAIGLDEHFDVGEVTLSIAGETVRLTGAGGASLSIDQGTHDVSAFARDAEGDELRASIDISSSNQSVARYSTLTGTLVAAPGSAQLTVAVMHGAHADFEQSVTLNVR